MKINNNGTPKTMNEAIENALQDGASAENIRAHIIDFLAQKFNVAMLSGNAEQEQSIIKLWNKVKG